MKKVLYSSLAACMLMLASCDKDYLEVQPTDAVAGDLAITTTTNAMAALNGIHRAMFMQYDNQDQAGQGSVMINLDLLGEDVVMTAAGNGWFNSTYKWMTHRNANAGTVSFVYRFYYKIIANANKIIEGIDTAEGTPAERAAIKGQALAYRAWAHHQLVQIFAERYDASKSSNDQLGVPIMNVYTLEGQPRATVEQVYAQINKDIDEAISLLPARRNAKSHFNTNVAKGIKARVALTMQDWATAAKFANEAAQGYKLMGQTQYLAGFNNVENEEWMWGSDQISDQTTYFYSYFAYMSANFSSSNIRANPKAINSQLYSKIPNTDVRKQLWDPTPTEVLDETTKKVVGYDVNGYVIPSNFSPKPYMNRKFLADGGASSVGDVPYMRAAEMMLIEAEALARMGNNSAAAALLTKLVKARDTEASDITLADQALIDEIMKQRRIELWGEGFRFFDLKRTNSPLNRNGANHSATLAGNVLDVAAGDNQWQWLIPQDELNSNNNEGMVQNPL
ncbi:RagB/SusD family nutrient uptake outer membrane protein [Pontibacter actiniarum]|uniref:RagB/SusD family nutrient uptake outer membrane protein n=1 Tax=Pontibacter actiniarum TaxID=323450 RepID=A0A1X9YM81_9BACT|nr:RagB/SusD family nutrient uptake outer membrane protein [Pontibacter actiniarum]ARS33980.1 RagB/SusD family nutrient uptake outer membrane protein [Pontibacter actiniarum]